MKTKLMKLILLMLILAGAFTSCKNEYLSDEKAIVGKWKPISQSSQSIGENKMIPVDSKGEYIEYFSDRTKGYYDTITEKIQINGNYQIQSGLLIYDYDKSYEQGRVDYKCEFSHNNNQLKLTFVNGMQNWVLGMGPEIFIYQRIK